MKTIAALMIATAVAAGSLLSTPAVQAQTPSAAQATEGAKKTVKKAGAKATTKKNKVAKKARKTAKAA
jgi:hypothetical protein